MAVTASTACVVCIPHGRHRAATVGIENPGRTKLTLVRTWWKDPEAS
jgi:hypothetical protein